MVWTTEQNDCIEGVEWKGRNSREKGQKGNSDKSGLNAFGIDCIGNIFVLLTL